jgi:cytochrome c553
MKFKNITMNRIFQCVGFCFFIACIFGGNVFAQSLQEQQWASSCFSCHGTDGYSKGAIPSLAGLDKNEMIEKMLAFKTGQRQATIMHQISKGYNTEQIEKIAQYFSLLPKEIPLKK